MQDLCRWHLLPGLQQIFSLEPTSLAQEWQLQSTENLHLAMSIIFRPNTFIKKDFIVKKMAARYTLGGCLLPCRSPKFAGANYVFLQRK